MDKKSVSEIKTKCFNRQNCRIDRMRACYVNEEKGKLSTFHDMFLQLADEEQTKYCEIFRRSMSGKFGRNLYNVSFPAAEEAEGGHQAFLYQLQQSELKDDALVEQFFDRVVGSYSYPGKYLILLSHGVYDIPMKMKDGAELDSEYVYSFLLCSICPVELLHDGLCYDKDEQTFRNRTDDWGVKNPETAFLFPAYHLRNTDIHSALYFSRHPEERHEEIALDVLGTELSRTEKDQQDVFREIIETTLAGSCTFDTVRSIQEDLQEMIEDNARDQENDLQLELDRTDVKKLLSRNGATEEQLLQFERIYDEAVGDDTSPLLAENIQDQKYMVVKSATMKLDVKAENAGLVETRVIDGREYLLIPIADDIEVNGIRIRQNIEGAAD